MESSVLAEIMRLKALPRAALEQKYAELFNGEKPLTTNRIYLWRRIAHRMQEQAYGGVSPEAQERIKELITEYDPVNNKTLRPQKPSRETNKDWVRDPRLPIPGTTIIKDYKSTRIEVKVLERGFEYNSVVYPTLSSIAKAITGDHWNGYAFFRV
jgi:hypothetical protein